MSWHTSALVIEGNCHLRATELLAELGFSDRQPLFETDDPGVGFLPGQVVGVMDGWTVVWDPQTFFGLFPLDDHAAPPDGRWEVFENSIWPKKLDSILAHMSSERRVFTFIAEGAAESCGFAWYTGGGRRRAYLSLQGEAVFQDGAPLAEEATAEAEECDPEQRLFVLCRMLTGVLVAPTSAVRFTVYGNARSAPGAAPRLAHLISGFAAQLVSWLSLARMRNKHRVALAGGVGTFPAMAVRDLVVFPGSVVPFFVGRAKSLRAAEAALRANGYLVLASQKNAANDDPAIDEIYSTGTLVKLLQFLEVPDDGTAKLLVEAVNRVKILNFTDRAGCREAKTTQIDDAVREDLRPLATRVCENFQVYAARNGFPDVLVESVVRQFDHYGLFADRVATYLLIDVHDKQMVLETTALSERLEMLLKLMNKPRPAQRPRPSIQEIVSEFSQAAGPPRQLALALPIQNGDARMAVDRLVAAYGDGHHTSLFDGTATFPCPLTLDDVELRLDQGQFVRAHRNHIVNINSIAAVRRDGGDILLEVAGTPMSAFPVSRGRLSWLKTRGAVLFMRRLRAARESSPAPLGQTVRGC